VKTIDDKRPPRAVVVGYGFAGRDFHSYLIGITPGLDLHGVFVRDAERRARAARDRPDARLYDAYEDVLADLDVDLVILATPSATHAELAIAALNAGKHVVSDKVMCLSLADCDRMIEAAHRNDALLSVFQNRRWDGDFLTLRALMKDGALGDVRWVEMAWQGMGAWGGWRGKAEMGGGRFWDLGAHLVDQTCLLFPQPVESVYCRMHHDYADSDIDSEALIVVTFAGGCTAVCDLSGMTTVSKPRFLAHGSRATFAKHGLDPQEKAMIAADIDAAREDPANFGRVKESKSEERIVPTLPGRWRTYYENIADTLNGRAESFVTLSSVRRAMSVLDAAKRSAEAGEVVRLPAES